MYFFTGNPPLSGQSGVSPYNCSNAAHMRINCVQYQNTRFARGMTLRMRNCSLSSLTAGYGLLWKEETGETAKAQSVQ